MNGHLRAGTLETFQKAQERHELEGYLRPDFGAPLRRDRQDDLQWAPGRAFDIEQRQAGIPQVVDGSMEAELRLLGRFRAQLAVPRARQLAQLAENMPAAAQRERQLVGPIPRAGAGVPPVQFDNLPAPRNFGHFTLVLYSHSYRGGMPSLALQQKYRHDCP